MRFAATASLVALLVVLSAGPVTGQDTATAPELSMEQSWERAVTNLEAVSLALINQGRAHGESAAEVGARMGTLFGPSWSREPGTGTPRMLVRGMAANLQLWPDAEVAVSTSDGAYVLRYNRPWQDLFGDDGTVYDVSIDEFEAMWNAGVTAIGEYLGLDVALERDGDEWVMTVEDGG